MNVPAAHIAWIEACRRQRPQPPRGLTLEDVSNGMPFHVHVENGHWTFMWGKKPQEDDGSRSRVTGHRFD